MKSVFDSMIRAFGKPSSLLVCETDGFSLRGAVLNRIGGEVTVQYVAQSQLPDLEEAVNEVIERLRAQGWLGRKAVLLTPGVVPALLELPVDPAKPRSPEQMEELVRWEMEPLLMQHTTLWSMGRILVGMGYLTETQARAVIETQQGRGRPDNAMEVYSFRRFGDLAVELGYITRQHLDECLVRQEWLKTEGEEIACGWAPQEAAKEEGNGHRWMACAVSRALMARWESVFARKAVKLLSMYPLAACASASLGSGETTRLLLEAHGGVATATAVGANGVTGFHMQPESLWMLLESHAGLVTATNMHHGTASGFHMQQSSLSGALEACLEAYHALTPPEPDVLWLASLHEESGDLSARLREVLGCDVRVLSGTKGENGGAVTPGMVGAARHAMGLAGARLCCEISMNGPRKPLKQRVEIRAVAAGLVLAVLIGGAELALQVRKDLALETKARIDKEAATLDASVARINAEIDRIKQLQDALKSRREEVGRAEDRVRFFGEELPQRAALVQSLLATLEQSVTEEVVIDRIEEIAVTPAAMRSAFMPVGLGGVQPPPGGFRLNAWSLNETAAQQFVQAVKGAIRPWGMDVVEITVIAQTGRLGLQGNAVSLRLVKPSPVPDTTKPALSGSRS